MDKNKIKNNIDKIQSLLSIESSPNAIVDTNNGIEYAWYVGASQDGEDLTDVFVNEKRWENFYAPNYYTEDVNKIKVGDRIVIKSTFAQKNDLPFNSHGKTVGVACFKAIGIVTDNPQDGANLKVEWEKLNPFKKWYGPGAGSLRSKGTAIQIKSDNPINKAMLEYTFSDIEQDYTFCEAKYGITDGEDDDFYDYEYILPKFETNYQSNFPRNLIYFGAPGTGKSWQLNKDKDDLLGENNETDYERVTFHSNYSYAHFVGTYKPVMKANKYDINIDNSQKEVLQILNNKTLSAQEKYNILYEKFEGQGETKKIDGTSTDNSVEKKHGKALISFVNLKKYNDDSSEIAYEYVPGPFIRVLVKALKNARTDSPRPFLLIIEEINRSEVAAVFGDIFQLLDRGDDNSSEYFIQTSEDLQKYLAKSDVLGGNPEDYEKIKIPDNMFIWATMNSADQGVYPMDTAFKRRWDFKYIGINEKEDKIKNNTVNLGDESTPDIINWNKLRMAINNKLSDIGINEDKLFGPYFLSNKIVGQDPIDPKLFKEAFKDKVITYLFEDVTKYKREKIFNTENDVLKINSYSDIRDKFDTLGINIFCKEIVNQVKTGQV
ncbi:hypothetical protein IJ541_07515 [bacterium]|nr:hypothetical protein [bacterium]